MATDGHQGDPEEPEMTSTPMLNCPAAGPGLSTGWLPVPAAHEHETYRVDADMAAGGDFNGI